MPIWHRIFAASTALPDPQAVCELVQSFALLRGSFFEAEGSDWIAADLDLGGNEPVHLERFLATEAGIRGELNSWAAWLETREDNPHSSRLMEQMIQTAQLFLLRGPTPAEGPDALGAACVGLCRYLAEATRGVYHIDGQGLFAADGTLLVEE
jgi:hypothetical protein